MLTDVVIKQCEQITSCQFINRSLLTFVGGSKDIKLHIVKRQPIFKFKIRTYRADVMACCVTVDVTVVWHALCVMCDCAEYREIINIDT